MLLSVVAEFGFMGLKRAACGGAHVADLVVQLAGPLGPFPLAACDLAPVLAWAVPSGRPVI